MSVAAHSLDRFDEASAEEVLEWALGSFGERIAISTSFQAEGVVIIDLARRISSDVRVFTIDTGRLPQETYTLIDEVRDRYEIDVELFFPAADRIEAMVRRNGLNLFYKDPALRLLCCHVRKVEPLERALSGLDAWVTGLRRAQGVTRTGVSKVEIDESHAGIVKVNPIADWSSDDVWDYVRANDVPTNALYEQGYTSIGCAPCTRPIQPGEDDRAGRWWWEAPEAKECGIHGTSRPERFQLELERLTETAP
jgi:thioredoxin-dependent adenylylsulfate APS reductase